jgi:hypothetical protein
MDLMFDVQVLGHGPQNKELPEEVLGSIAAYYRRVTTLARPMGHVVGGVMLIGILTLVLQTLLAGHSRWIGGFSLLLFGAPVAMALFRVYPNAVRLGSRADPVLEQSRLARAIHKGHLFCLGAMLSFVLLQLLVGSP